MHPNYKHPESQPGNPYGTFDSILKTLKDYPESYDDHIKSLAEIILGLRDGHLENSTPILLEKINGVDWPDKKIHQKLLELIRNYA